MSTNPYHAPMSQPGDQTPKSRVVIALVCLHVSAILYLLLGISLPLLLTLAVEAESEELDPAASLTASVCLLTFCVLIAVGVELVAYGIHKRKFWGWVAGLVVFGLYAPSLFFPLGLLGFWGLLAAGSRAEFGIGVPGGQAT